MSIQSSDLWDALDKVASTRGMTASGLARKAGLDRTAFNRSKREQGGTDRWPSTLSLVSALKAADMSLSEYAAMIEGSISGNGVPIPSVAMSRVADGFDRFGRRLDEEFEKIIVPADGDENEWAIRIDVPSEGVFKKGAVVLLDDRPDWRDDDIVFVLTQEGQAGFRTFRRSTLEHTVVSPIGSDEEIKIDRTARPRLSRVKTIVF